MNDNNKILLSGKVASEPKYSHEVYGEKFYIFDLVVERLSGNCDVLPVMISERLTDISAIRVNEIVTISGQIRTYNERSRHANKLIITVFPREIDFFESEEILSKNELCIECTIVRMPTYRTTPLNREITDFLVAVNRPYGKSDYIPCIAWGRNARFINILEVGTKLKICGRLQSRQYFKMFENGIQEIRTAYEVSVSRIDIVKELSEGEE